MENPEAKKNISDWRQLMYLNWQHLIYFLVAAELGSFTKAANQLFITQSTLTKAMNSLEGTLGCPLFEKKGRNIRLTTFGEQFYTDMKELAASMGDNIQTLHDMMDLKSGSLSIGGSYTMCAEYLPSKIRRYRKDYPDVDFSIKYTATSTILNQLLEGSIELGFCGDYDDTLRQYENIERYKIREEEVILILPRGSSMAETVLPGQPDVADISKFGGKPFIVNSKSNTGTNFVFNRVCEEHGITPDIAFESNDDHTMIGMVVSGLGYAMIADSPSLIAPSANRLLRRHLPGRPVKNLYMVFNKEREMSPLAKSFIQFIHDDEWD